MLCLALLALLLAVGCGTQVADRSKALMKLHIGMTKEEVVSAMGNPARREMRGDTEVWFYAMGSSEGEQEDAMPLSIIGGRLVGWGRLDYERSMRPINEMRRTN